MTDNVFGSLEDVALRDAWRHEALNFTPWLSSNPAHLGKAIGLDLELIRIESSLPSADDAFSADILARNVADDSNVLIENQLERSDHDHLGQILTYLAGLEAKTIVWIAPQFRSAHLAAIRWLNENTREEFSFFAVRIRTVRIGSSPIAPLFDVIERPNFWEKAKQASTRSAKIDTAQAAGYRDFWNAYLERYPEDEALGFKFSSSSNQWLPAAGDKVVGVWLARFCGVYVRGRKSVSNDQTLAELEPHRAELETATGLQLKAQPGDWLLVKQSDYRPADKAKWPEAMDWIHQNALTHLRVLDRVAVREDRDSSLD